MDKSIEKIGRRRAERKAEPENVQRAGRCGKARRAEGTVKNRLLWEE